MKARSILAKKAVPRLTDSMRSNEADLKIVRWVSYSYLMVSMGR
jgi:hypothetical protein